MQGIKYHSPKRHKKSLKHARLLVLQRFYFLRTVKDGIITANGMEMSEPAPNPNYVRGVTRMIYEFITDFLPAGQGLQMWQLEIRNSVRMLMSSIAITVLTTSCGIIVFKRKDLK